MSISKTVMKSSTSISWSTTHSLTSTIPKVENSKEVYLVLPMVEQVSLLSHSLEMYTLMSHALSSSSITDALRTLAIIDRQLL